MISLAVLLFLPFLTSGKQLDSGLIQEGLTNLMECAAELGIKYDLCMEMLKPETKREEAKYDNCKCWIRCVSKRMKVMSEDGKFNEGEILKRVNGLETPGLKEEGLKVYETCKNVEGSECVAGFNMVACILKNSQKARDIVKQIMALTQGDSA